MASSSSNPRNIRFIAVARVPDRVIVATYGPRTPMERETAMILESAKYLEHPRLTFQNPESHTNIHYEYFTNTQNLYLVVTPEAYKQSHAFSFLRELSGTFEKMHAATFPTANAHSLTRSSYKLFIQLVSKYQYPDELDKVAAVSEQVEQVKGIMQDNINNVMTNNENLEDLVQNTENMGREASEFQRGAQAVRRQMSWRNKRVLVTALAGLALFVAAIACFVTWRKKSAVPNRKPLFSEIPSRSPPRPSGSPTP